MVTTIVLVIPITFQEVAVGQYTGHSGMNMISKFCPILKAAGMASMVLAFLVSS
jgi:solute carrier family 6 GABA transporter-like protein 6/8/11/12/13